MFDEDPPSVRWRTSSYSGDAGTCVEVALGESVSIRHSNDPDGPVLEFTRGQWRVLLDAIKRDAPWVRAGGTC
jgi:hypothetical protein